MALIRCLPALDNLKYVNKDQKMGAEIVRKALRIPCYTIASNAGVDAQEVVAKVMSRKENFAWPICRHDEVWDH